MGREELRELVRRLASRDPARSEATLQADVRQLLLTGPLGLAEDQVVDLESQVGNRRRIDVEVGFTIIEVKKDLRQTSIDEAEEQLGDYVLTRTRELGQRYVGILTDGAEWIAYTLADNQLSEVARLLVSASKPDVDALLVWLEGVLATTQGIAPIPRQVVRRLGPTSTAHLLDRATLQGLYDEHASDSSVALKRELWAKVLTTALGTQFEDSDELFIEHTLLVNSAEIIAHALLGFEIATLQPATLLSGQRFEHAQVYGVVEEDFFDWVLEVPGGESYVRGLVRRLGRFDWAIVDHDVLKVLYESIIGAETRKRLGEYYTPDWLAERMIERVVTDPLEQRVLDPSCGSGTFLFHAVRRFLDESETEGIRLDRALEQLTDRVLGVDLHPVAVALARVTYLLAIGQERLTNEGRGPITVPVYLGDSVQWHQRSDLFSSENLVVATSNEEKLFEAELIFPDRLLDDAAKFDRLVKDLADLASKPRQPGQVPSLGAVFNRLGIRTEDQPTIESTFAVMCQLHDEGRDHIWSYYVRNLARPVWLAKQKNRVDVLVGNPPWLAYRHMTEAMQEEFRELSQTRGLWHGATVATHQDLSALFLARTVQLYLRLGGAFAFVMPNAALDRGYYEGFRSGRYAGLAEGAGVVFDDPWDLRRLRPHFFPRAASVVMGIRVELENGRRMPTVAERWTGRLPADSDSWTDVEGHVLREEAGLWVRDVEGEPESPYRKRFTQGATLVPRLLFMVEEQPSSPLGVPAGRRAVRSARSSYEKEPWRSLPAVEGVVEEEFVRPALLSESVLPYRLLELREAVVPVEGSELLRADGDRIDLYPGLAQWWRTAEEMWVANRSSDRLDLSEQLDYRSKLSVQVPAQRERIVYTASGMHLSAARVADPRAIIDKSLYWATAHGSSEASYLCAILNSPVTTELVRPLMSYGKDERHIDKFVWDLPIPPFNEDQESHVELAELGTRAEEFVAGLDLDESVHFPTLRRQVREALASSELGREVEGLVRELIS